MTPTRGLRNGKQSETSRIRPVATSTGGPDRSKIQKLFGAWSDRHVPRASATSYPGETGGRNFFACRHLNADWECR